MGLGPSASTAFDFISQVSLGNISGYSVFTKKGQNPAVSNGVLPVDLWSQNSLYTGFNPTAAVETYAISSDDTDTGTLTVTGLLTPNDTAYTSKSITLTGTSAVQFSDNFYRIHSARYSSGGDTTFNAGDIKVYFSGNVDNLFLQISTGKSQSYMGGFTIPAENQGLLYDLRAQVKDGASAVNGDGALWVRTFEDSPRLRRPLVFSSLYETKDLDFAPIVLSAKTDIIPRIISLSNNNLFITISYNVLTVKTS